MARLSKDERERRKEWARLLYTKENRLQKDIAATVGVSEKTIGEWKHAGKWDQLKESLTKTRQQQIKELNDQLNEFNKFINSKPQGSRFPDSKESDSLKKLTSAIKDLSNEVNISDAIDSYMTFANWYRQIDFKKAQEIVELFDQHVQTLLK